MKKAKTNVKRFFRIIKSNLYTTGFRKIRYYFRCYMWIKNQPRWNDSRQKFKQMIKEVQQ